MPPVKGRGNWSHWERHSWSCSLLSLSVVLESFGGAFSTYATVQAELPASSTAVAVGAPVEYRNVTVGTVASQGRSVPGGFVVLTLHMQTQMLPEIPAQVRATETPVSFFGDPYVELISSSPPGSARLHAGEAIPALQTAQTGSLQTTLGSLDSLLINLHPAELDAALTALASSLQGNGTSLGHNFGQGQYLLSTDAPALAHGRLQSADAGSGGEPVRSLHAGHSADPG